MSDDKIAEIRERWAEFEMLDHQSQVWDAHLHMRRAHNDRTWLLAEDARHRAENERLRGALTEISQYETSAPAGFEWDIVVEELVEIARKALEAKP